MRTPPCTCFVFRLCKVFVLHSESLTNYQTETKAPSASERSTFWTQSASKCVPACVRKSIPSSLSANDRASMNCVTGWQKTTFATRKFEGTAIPDMKNKREPEPSLKFAEHEKTPTVQ